MKNQINTMRYIISSLLFSILLVSCSPYGSIYINTQKPAKIYIPNDIKVVTFVIRNSITQIQDSFINASKFNKEVYMNKQSYYDISFEGFYDILNKTGRYERIMYYKEDAEILNDSIEQKPLNWISAGLICEKTGSDLLVVLEDPLLFLGISESGNNCFTSWVYKYRIYDPYNFKIIDEYLIKDSSPSDGNSSPDDEIQQRAYQLGQMMAERINPENILCERLYYNKGNSIIRLGAFYIEKGDYDTAISIWRKLLDSPVKAEWAFKACLNIAMAEELKGDFSSSLRYATMSMNYLKLMKYEDKDMNLVKERLEILKERIIEEDRLNK